MAKNIAVFSESLRRSFMLLHVKNKSLAGLSYYLMGAALRNTLVKGVVAFNELWSSCWQMHCRGEVRSMMICVAAGAT